MKVLLNFAHPLSQPGWESVQALLGGSFANVHRKLRIDFFDDRKPMEQQVTEAIDSAEAELRFRFDMPSLDCATGVYVISPGLSDPAALIPIEIRARTGSFPVLVLMRRSRELRTFLAYGLIDGQDVMYWARSKRPPMAETS